MSRFHKRGDATRTTRRSKYLSVFLLLSGSVLFTANATAAELIINGDFEMPDLTDQLAFPDGSRAADKGWTSFFGQNYTGVCSTDIGVECNGDMLIPGWSVLWTDTLLDPVPTPGRLEIQHNSLVDRVNPALIAAGGTPLVYAKTGMQKAELDSHDRYFPPGIDANGELVAPEKNPNTNVSAFQEFEVCPRTAYKLTYSWKSRTTELGDNDVRVVANGTVVRINTLNNNWQTETIHFVTPDDTESGLAFVSIGTGSTKGMSLDAVSLVGPSADNCPPPPQCHDDDDSSDDGSSDDGSSDDGSSDDGSSDDGSSDDNGSHDGDHDSSDGDHDSSDGDHDSSDGDHDSSDGDHHSSDGDHHSSDGDHDSSDDNEPVQCGIDEPKDDGTCGFCSGNGFGPSSLTLLYDGNGYTLHGQAADQVSIIPDTLALQQAPVNAQITVYNEFGDVLFAGEVEIGHFFTVNGLSGSLTIDISEPASGDLVQTIEFQTSCDQPLKKFDEFGAITVWNGSPSSVN